MKNKTILVTGSSRGIGRGIALQLAERGFSVAINYAGNRAAAEETAELCRKADSSGQGRFVPFRADIGDQKDRRELIGAVIREYGGFQGLVNNAGVAPRERADLLEMTEESFDRVMSINLRGSFFLSQEAARYWLSTKDKEQFRSMIFVTSVSAEMTSVNRGEYCLSKAGLAMTAALFATRLAPCNIGVYEIRPGIIKTDMTSGVRGKYDSLISEGLVPQKRWGLPEDIGRAAAALVSGEMPYSTGSVIHVDGGLHIPRF